MRIIFVFISFLCGMQLLFSQNSKKPMFDDYFIDKTLRIDYQLVGNSLECEFVVEQMKQLSVWAGNKNLSKDNFLDLGKNRFTVYDSATNVLIYQKGFCSLFDEFQFSSESEKEKKAYYHVNLMPFPKRTVRYVLERRERTTGEFHKVADIYINPANYFIKKESASEYEYVMVQGGGNINERIDIAFIAEGYTADEMDKFVNDVKRIWSYIATVPPFDTLNEYFNIYAVKSPSKESGTDIPGEGIYKNTLLNFSFYTFDIERYLTTKDIKSLYDVAESVPYDQIFVVVNTAKYGGGGFYNYYSAVTADNSYTLKVAIHEFGHGFAGLADEYYTSEVPTDSMYSLSVEPWEPNITTLVDFQSKWQDMVSDTVPVPTPRIVKYQNSIGAFEGGGYVDKGIYSPYQDCRMKSNNPEGFCPVCSKAIERVIRSYCDK